MNLKDSIIVLVGGSVLVIMAIVFALSQLPNCIKYRDEYGWVSLAGTYNHIGSLEDAIKASAGRPIKKHRVCDEWYYE